MAAPDREQREQFKYVQNNIRVMALWGYLYDGNNQTDIGIRLFPGQSRYAAGERISLIMRCYGFDSDTYRSNKGIFGNWRLSDGNTVKSYIEKSDVEAFVRAFPGGCDFTGKGEQMQRFIVERIEKKLEKIRKTQLREQKERDAKIAAENERRRVEAEIRRRRAEEEARLRRERKEQEARIRKQIEEAKKAAFKYELDQLTAKTMAQGLVISAQDILKNAVEDEDITAGILKYLEAFAITWEEQDNFGLTHNQSLVRSQYPDFLIACEQMAVEAYSLGDINAAMLFANAACALPKKGTIEFDTFGQTFGKRDEEFHPELTCLEIMRRCLIQAGDLMQAEDVCFLEERAIAIARLKPEDIIIKDIPEFDEEDADCDDLMLPEDDWLDIGAENATNKFETDAVTMEEMCKAEDAQYEKHDNGWLVCMRRPEIKVCIGMYVCSNAISELGSVALLAKDSKGDLKYISLGYDMFAEKCESKIRIMEGLPVSDTYRLVRTDSGEKYVMVNDVAYKLDIPWSLEKAITVEVCDVVIDEPAAYSDQNTLYEDYEMKITTTAQGGVFIQGEKRVIAYPDINYGNASTIRYENGMIVEIKSENNFIIGVMTGASVTEWYDIEWGQS